MAEIKATIIQVYGDYRIPIMAFCCLMICFVLGKGRRKGLLVPFMLIAIAVANPLTRKIWNAVDTGKVYWRALWMLPIGLVCAYLAASIVEKAKSWMLRAFAVAFMLTTIVWVVQCTNNGSSASFMEAENADKLPGAVKEVADILLGMETEPHVVSEPNLSVYLRQYSGHIRAPYARDVVYGTPSVLGNQIHTALSQGDFQTVSQLMLNHDYGYLVIANGDEKDALVDAGFELVEQVREYGIYLPHGTRTEDRTYNTLGQVSSVTLIDATGTPINGPDGYSKIIYEYDRYGRGTYEFRTDTQGRGIADSHGRAGYRCERNRYGWNVSQTWLGSDGEPTNDVVTGYATFRRTYDRHGNIIAEQCFDAEGKLTLNSDGYATTRREYDGQYREVKCTYFDLEGMPTDIGASGYASYTNEYRDDGCLSLTYFYDSDDNLVDCGSRYLHDYLRSLNGRDFIIVIKDEGTRALTETIMDDLKALGITTELIGKGGSAFYALVVDGTVMEAIDAQSLAYDGEFAGARVSIRSAGFNYGNIGSIVVDGKEWSKNKRGMNIVVLEEGRVVESVAFDTYVPEMTVTW